MIELTADRLVLVENGAAVEYPGSIDDYMDGVLGRSRPKATAKLSGKSVRKAGAQADGDVQALRKAAAEAELRSAQLAAECEALDRAMSNYNDTEAKLASLPMRELSQKRAQLAAELANAEARWLEASEQLEQLAA
jgi:ATP-binding cassette subfamily F protein 3